MDTRLRIQFAIAALLFFTAGAPEAQAQIILGRPRPPRPPRIIPAENHPSLGVLIGPTSRSAHQHTDGLEVAFTGEMPLHDGLRGRVEVGASTWSSLTLTRMTAGLYRVSGTSPFHGFAGLGLGLYRHRVDGEPASGSQAGLHGGFGFEYVGRRRGYSAEVRLGVAPSSKTPDGGVLQASLLFGWKRVFR